MKQVKSHRDIFVWYLLKIRSIREVTHYMVCKWLEQIKGIIIHILASNEDKRNTKMSV